MQKTKTKDIIKLSDHFTYKRLARFTLAPIAMMIFTSIYGVVDGIFVSNFVGTTEFASLNLIMPLLIILGAVGFMLGTGGTAIVSKTFGLGDKARSMPMQLSGGEQQRVGLARALVNAPDLIIADEPTGNVDPNMSYEIVSLLTEINKKGTTILMVTHDHNLVRDFQHRVIMLDSGKIIADNVGGDI